MSEIFSAEIQLPRQPVPHWAVKREQANSWAQGYAHEIGVPKNLIRRRVYVLVEPDGAGADWTWNGKIRFALDGQTKLELPYYITNAGFTDTNYVLKWCGSGGAPTEISADAIRISDNGGAGKLYTVAPLNLDIICNKIALVTEKNVGSDPTILFLAAVSQIITL